jgi:MoxR-like ATPase
MSLNAYSGNERNSMPDFNNDERLKSPSRYVASAGLKNAVNVAIHLGCPLLVTGEPGTGKTQLAFNIAWSLGLDAPLVFNTRTTSVATDLFYKYDAIGHFQYGQNKEGRPLSNDDVENRFIRYQAMGTAIRSNQRQVVLIDEIDKAPRDLPNDILNILEDLSFEVPETGKSYSAAEKNRPIIILTSNSEKNLPEPFLRRCVFYHINFPKEEQLLEIITAKLGNAEYNEEDLRTIIIPHFMKIRDLVQHKKPGTAELIYWVVLLSKMGFDALRISNYSVLPPEEKQRLYMTYNVLAKNEQDLKLLANFLDIKS